MTSVILKFVKQTNRPDKTLFQCSNCDSYHMKVVRYGPDVPWELECAQCEHLLSHPATFS